MICSLTNIGSKNIETSIVKSVAEIVTEANKKTEETVKKVSAETKETVNEVKKELIEEIKKRPHVLNLYIGDNIYDDLVNKMGKKDAVDFLVRAANDNNPLSVIDKLYLGDDSRDNWPIAYKEGVYKYLNKDREMIIDETGSKIGELFGKVHNAMIQAVSEVINQNLSGGTVEGMYDTYNMLKIQRNLYKICGRTEILCSKLQSKVKNPVHPFFQKYFIELFFDDRNKMKQELDSQDY
jgi:hypothetical protein